MLPDNHVIIAAIAWLFLGLIAELSAKASFRRGGQEFKGRHVFISYTLGPILVPTIAVVAFGWAFIKVAFRLGRH